METKFNTKELGEITVQVHDQWKGITQYTIYFKSPNSIIDDERGRVYISKTRNSYTLYVRGSKICSSRTVSNHGLAMALYKGSYRGENDGENMAVIESKLKELLSYRVELESEAEKLLEQHVINENDRKMRDGEIENDLQSLAKRMDCSNDNDDSEKDWHKGFKGLALMLDKFMHHDMIISMTAMQSIIGDYLPTDIADFNQFCFDYNQTEYAENEPCSVQELQKICLIVVADRCKK